MPALDEVYRKFGEVAEAAQLLEVELGTIQLCAEGMEHDLFAGDKGELATEIYNKIDVRTLGRLLNQLAKRAGFPRDSNCCWRMPLRSATSYSIPSTESTTSGGTRTRAVRRCSTILTASMKRFSTRTRQSCVFRGSTSTT